MQEHRYAKAGFSLIEILIVLGIIGLIMAGIVPYVTSKMKQAKVEQARTEVKKIASEIELYRLHVGEYPTRLIDLVKQPQGAEGKWNGPYVPGNKEPMDPWGQKYIYRVTPGGDREYELSSYGPKGKGAPKSEWIVYRD